ncbi:MAG: glutamate racemase [Spirochaetales bacterium]|nr:glutamate racemase [Spirochaetales bacterium]
MPSLETRKRPVAFLDSGIGGVPYLDRLREKLPRENYLYLADHKNFPYGEKSAEEVTASVLGAADSLMARHNPKMIILACNTASVSSLAVLRSRVSIPVVGVVPAVKPAAARSGERTIGVMATERTVNAPYLDGLIEQFAVGCRVVRVAAGDIVSFVENRLFLADREEQDRLIAPAVEEFRREKVDSIVLGCTHFTYLDDNIRALSRGNFIPVDSREGVANQAIRLLERDDMLCTEGEGRSLFYTTRAREDGYYRKVAEQYSLDFRGEISSVQGGAA